MATHIFPKSQRLKSRKKLQQLFAEGKSVRTKELRLIYLAEKNDTPDIRCGVGLSTKNFKQAVTRNRIKRLLREAYRLQRQQLQIPQSTSPIQLSLFFLYTGKDLPSYQSIYESVGVALHKLSKTLHAAAAVENT